MFPKTKAREIWRLKGKQNGAVPGTQRLHALLYIQRTKPIEFSVTSRELVTNCLEDSLKVISPQFLCTIVHLSFVLVNYQAIEIWSS